MKTASYSSSKSFENFVFFYIAYCLKILICFLNFIVYQNSWPKLKHKFSKMFFFSKRFCCFLLLCYFFLFCLYRIIVTTIFEVLLSNRLKNYSSNHFSSRANQNLSNFAKHALNYQASLENIICWSSQIVNKKYTTLFV